MEIILSIVICVLKTFITVIICRYTGQPYFIISDIGSASVLVLQHSDCASLFFLTLLVQVYGLHREQESNFIIAGHHYKEHLQICM